SREVRTGVDRVPGLLEKQRVLEQTKFGIEPAEFGQLAPRLRVPAFVTAGECHDAIDREAVCEVVARSLAQHFLFGREGEVHRLLLTRPGETDDAFRDDVAQDLRRSRLDRVAAAA